MKIAMGILAYNEERTIGSTISSLAEQSVFENTNHTISIHVVPNGCRDATALLAREALESLKKRHPSVQVEVNELTEGGKANAWNHFVHEFSPADAEGLLLLDADIHFGERECLERVVQTLMESPAAVVAVDLPLKDIALKINPSVRERLSVNASHLQSAGTPKIAGSLYFARADALRSFWMPLGLLVEDGFVKAMLLTDSFRHPERSEGIIRAPEATHYFKAVTGLKDWFSHERRLLNGTALNILLFSYIQQLVRDGEDPNWVIQENNKRDPFWVVGLAKAYRATLPGGLEFMGDPLRRLTRLPTQKKFAFLPTALLRTGLNIAVFLACQSDFKLGRLDW